jgi:regulator of protease activity HflC (stomatin/prohibitin superfamily)
MKVIVEAWEKGLKFRNGRFLGIVEPGRHRVWRIFVRERIDKIDLRAQTLSVAGQEMMTADKVTLRLNVVAGYRIADPVAATMKVANAWTQLYTDVQLALREAVAARTLDELIAEKTVLGDRVFEALKLTVAGYGVELLEVGVKDVVLPGDLKAPFVRVLEARKRAEAAQIERREEVAATRSLANTAQLLEKNPTLMKLKVLESLEKIAGAGAKIVLPADFLSEKNET